MRSSSILPLLLFLASAASPLQAQEPRFFPQETQVAGDIFANHMWGGNQRVSRVAYHNGFLYTSTQNFTPRVRVWDIEDPRNPTMLHEFPSVNSGHQYGILDNRIDFSNGNASFDATNPLVPLRVDGGLTTSGAGRVFFYPFAFSFASSYNSGTPATFTITDQRTDSVLATFDPVADAGVVGKPIAIGNLLIYAALHNSSGVATYDISDPTQPRFLDSIDGVGGYEPSIWRHYIVLTHEDEAHSDMRGMTLIDFSDPTNLRVAGHMPAEEMPGIHRYTQFQDQYGFTGQAKIDMTTLSVVQEYPKAGITDEYSLPLGNLIAFGQFNGRCTIIAHQSEPDTLPPTVAYHLPADGAVDQAITSRIGIVIHETLASETVRYGESVIVRPLGGETIPGILYRNDLDILQFTPDEALLPGTTYEVLLPAGGIHDVCGNPIAEYRFTFTTAGDTPITRPVIDSVALDPTPVAPNAPITVSVSASHPLGDSLEYRFDWGDGSQADWSSNPTAQHSYPSTDHYQLGVQVRDESGDSVQRTFVITVTEAQAGPEPLRSSPIVLAPATQQVWCVNPDNDSIASVATDDHAVQEFPTATGPVSLAVAPDGAIWVSCRDADLIQILDPQTGAELATLPLDYGSAPHGLLIDPQAEAAYVACQGSGELLRFDTAQRSRTHTLDVGPDARALAISPDRSELLVTRFRSPVSGGEVTRVDLASMTIATRHQLAVDPGPDSAINSRGLPNYLVAASFIRAGDRAFIAAVKANIERGLALDGLALTHENTVRALVAALAPEDDLAGRFDIDNSDSPSALWVSPLDDYLLVALQGNNQVMIVDLLDGSTVVRMGVGAAPQGLCYDPASGKLFIKNFLDRTVTIYQFDEFLSRGRLPSGKLAEPSTVSTEALSPEVLEGKQIFYHAGDERMALEGYISCATCHLDGGHDGQVWDFTDRGEGLRNTTDLRGRRGMGHGTVHWSGNFDELQDFEHDIRGAFGGTGFLSDAEFNQGTRNQPLGDPKAGLDPDLDALAAYVSSLQTYPASPHRQADGSLTAAAERGRAIFERQDCISCHAGTDMTDSASGLRHDVGTLRPTSGQRLGQPLDGIDTPTLRGLWATAPYLHDGSAATIPDLIAQADALHGGMDALTASERDDLAAYLLQLDTTGLSLFGLHLYDADANTPISAHSPLRDDALIDRLAVGGNLTLVAESNLPGVESVVFTWTGTTSGQQTESNAPYAIAGDRNGDFTAWPIPPGQYLVTAIAYDANNGNGNEIARVTRAFTLVDGAPIEFPPIAQFSTDPASIPHNDAYQTIVLLDGSESSDPDGVITSYAWSIDDAQFVNGTTPADPIVQVVFSGANPEYNARLEVTDNDSKTDSLTRTITTDLPNPPPTSAGLNYEYFEILNLSQLPDFDTLTPIAAGTTANFDLGIRQRDDDFAVRFTGYLSIPTAGNYTFYTESDDGSALYLNDTLVVQNDGIHAPQESAGSIDLIEGLHPITVLFFENEGGELLNVSMEGPGLTKQAIADDQLLGEPSGLTYSAFAQTADFAGGSNLATADSGDQDGMSNALELFLNGNTAAADRHLIEPRIEIVNDVVIFTFRQRPGLDPSIGYGLLHGDSLHATDFVERTDLLATPAGTDPDGTPLLRYVVPMEGSLRGFFRLQVELPD